MRPKTTVKIKSCDTQRLPKDNRKPQTFVYKLHVEYFPIPNDAVDRRKLGSQLLILTVVLGLIRTFILVGSSG